MNDDHKIKSMKASVISMLVTLKVAEDGSADADSYREAVKDSIDEYLDGIQPDPTNWTSLKTKVFYDIYLMQREEEGTITAADLVRRGLTAGQFSDQTAYHQHCIRLSEDRKANANNDLTKVCSTCGEEKPASKFKHRGGAKCNACRSREYRERKNAP